MRFNELRAQFRNRLLFTSNDLHGGGALPHERVQLAQWAKEGFLLRLKRGVYTFGDAERMSPLSALSVAEPLYRPSYLSLEWALSYYGLIPDAVGTLTSVTTRKTAQLENPLGFFHYSTVQPDYFFGFARKPSPVPIWIASPEKALLDFIYLKIPKMEKLTIELFLEGYRLQNLGILRRGRLQEYIKRFPHRRIQEAQPVLLKLTDLHHNVQR